MYEMTYVELPPRARRIRCASIKLPSCPGTTSACAENTQTPLLKQHRTRNYLRVRGEYTYTTWSPNCFLELPPRARRIQNNIKHRIRIGGTTSACAENTTPQPHRPITHGNYLRVRGEYLQIEATESPTWELPPRARRIHLHKTRRDLIDGTTSACAENTLMRGLIWRLIWNYLRVRGEYTEKIDEFTPLWELPPRARRIQPLTWCFMPIYGTTSACAENTLAFIHDRHALGNYLRVRGEYYTMR